MDMEILTIEKSQESILIIEVEVDQLKDKELTINILLPLITM